MAAPKEKNIINLLPQEEFESSTVGRILTWILSSFRIIVIGVEMIVVLGFLSRFWLDARITDLNDEMKQKEAVLKSFSQFENEYKTLQHKLAIFSSFTSSDKPIFNLLVSTAGLVPADVTFDSVTLTNGKVAITAGGVSERSISQFVSSLKKSNSLQNVSLVRIDSDKIDSAINFTIEANFTSSSGGEN